MADQLYFSRDSKLFIEWAGTTGVWEVPVLDGFSFSQATNASEITLAEMEDTTAVSRRGRRLFNDSLAPVEWSFSTYVRPFKSAGSADGTNGIADATANNHHAVEEVLWALMAGADTYGSSTFSRTAQQHGGNGTVFTADTTDADISFQQSNRSSLPTATLYFVVNTAAANPVVYKINNAAVNEASIDFDVDGIATINWSGFGKEIVDFSGSVHRDATAPATSGETTADGTALADGEIWLDSDNDDAFHIVTDVSGGSYVRAIDEGTAATNNFIRNRLTSLDVAPGDTTTFPGDSSNKYTLTLTGGNITITNNITYLVPEELGTVNIPIENITGARSVTGSFTCYLTLDDSDYSTSGTSADFFNDLTSTAALQKVVNEFDLTFAIGGTAGTPRLEFGLPKAHVEIPAHSIEDVISLETTFHGLGSSISATDEIDIKYVGVTPT